VSDLLSVSCIVHVIRTTHGIVFLTPQHRVVVLLVNHRD